MYNALINHGIPNEGQKNGKPHQEGFFFPSLLWSEVLDKTWIMNLSSSEAISKEKSLSLMHICIQAANWELCQWSVQMQFHVGASLKDFREKRRAII